VEAAVTVAVIILVIIVGMFLIHRLNAQHAERIRAYRYSSALPGIGRRNRRSPPAPAPKAAPADATRREDREGRG
jgi:NADH:ubiquinone oxidoreductase subunit 3 (subunit A)